jgi:hypothetical protein
MALIDTPKRIKVDDFPKEMRPAMERLGNVYNFFAEQVTNVINGNIDFENMNRSLVTISVTVGSNGVPLNTTRFTADTGIIGINVINSSANVTSTPFIRFTPDGTGVYTINQVTGLVANTEYSLTVELIS